jgi:signal transduction histidine kinase
LSQQNNTDPIMEMTTTKNFVPATSTLEFAKAKLIVDQFVYNCSHCLSAPLKTIQGLLYLLRESESDPLVDQQQYIQMILQSIGKMEWILQEFDVFLDNFERPVESEYVLPESILQEVLLTFREQLIVKNIRVTWHVPGNDLACLDAGRFRTILSRLVSNAIKFNDPDKSENKIDIIIDSTAESCLLTVLDNGIGMKEEIQAKIFELFYRGSERSSGAGIGLCVVDELVKKMNGRTSVHSEAEHGTVFKVWIPTAAV